MAASCSHFWLVVVLSPLATCEMLAVCCMIPYKFKGTAIYHQYIKILTCVCLSVCVSVSDGSGMFVGRD